MYTSKYIIESLECNFNREESAMQFLIPDISKNCLNSLYEALGLVLDRTMSILTCTHNWDITHEDNLEITPYKLLYFEHQTKWKTVKYKKKFETLNTRFM